MKRILYLLIISFLVISYSCRKDEDSKPIYSVKVQLVYPNNETVAKDVKITFTEKDENKSETEALTDENGMAKLRLKAGVYEVTVSEKRNTEEQTFLFEVAKDVTISAGWDEYQVVKLELSKIDITEKYKVNVKLVYPGGTNSKKDVDVTLVRETSNTKFEGKTNEKGIAQLEVFAGKYELSVTEKRDIGNQTFAFSGKKVINVDKSWNVEKAVELALTKSDASKKYKVKVQLGYPAGENSKKGVEIFISSEDNIIDTVETNENGIANFEIVIGSYKLNVTDQRIKTNGTSVVFKGSENISITGSWDADKAVDVGLTKNKIQQIVIKELFVGGTPKDDGSGYFRYDKYAILYNNSPYKANITNVALAIGMPYNATKSNKYYDGSGLTYDSEGWMPAGQAVWHFNREVIVEPYKQVVIALANAIDNTVTYSQSINFENAEYFCTYDIGTFDHALTYVAPSAQIPTSNYLSALAYGAGTGWVISQVSPSFYIFATEDVSLSSFVKDASTSDLYGGISVLVSKKVPREWVVDGVEVFKYGLADAIKRFTNDIDAGFVNMTSQLGYSIYRNVDKDATEALGENKGKLVYGYSDGTQAIPGGTTDPSNIDAEASLKNGAIIIYKDSNNSSDDFHQRAKASLRTN